MGIRNEKIEKGHGLTPIVVPVISATGVTDGNVVVTLPGYGFTVERVESFCRTYTATLTYDVLVGSNVVVNDAAFATNTRTPAAFASGFTKAHARRGGATTTLTVRYTSNGTGALVNGQVVIYLRPYPQSGEVV